MDLIKELIIAIIILTIVIIFLITRIIINNCNIYDIKINKAKQNLKKELNKKFDVLLKVIDFLRNNVVLNEDPLYEFLNTNLKKVSLEELNNIIIDTDLIIGEYFEKNEKLINDESMKEINKELNELNIEIISTTKYYNKIATEYNNYIKRFPNNLIAKISKRKPLDKLKEVSKNKLKIDNND